MTQGNSPISNPATTSTTAELEKKRVEDRLAGVSAIAEGLTERDGKKSFQASIKIDWQSYEASITIGSTGFLVSMYGTKKYSSGATLRDSKIYKYRADGTIEGREGRRDPLVSGDRSGINLAGINCSYSPSDDYGDLAIRELRVAKNKNILPKAV